MQAKEMATLLMFACCAGVQAAEDENVGMLLSVGKVNANACQIKLQDATFPNSCPTAIYNLAYFNCNSSEGKELLAVALAAYVSGNPVRITTDACSAYGISAAR